MPWQEVSIMEQRREFVRLAMQEGTNRRELCRRFGIHPDTGYKWLRRWAAGETAMTDRSRRPHSSPARTDAAMEAQVLSVRDAHRAWGARKIAHCLKRKDVSPPALSTVHQILCRHGRIIPPPRRCPGASTLRERSAEPSVADGLQGLGKARQWSARCYPLTIIDDHSRYVPCLQSCPDQQRATVQGHLNTTFLRYGLPDAIFVDNGSPWGASSGTRHWTRLRVWLLKLGTDLIYSRPYHPQGRGKNERFHRTLREEVFAFQNFDRATQVQRAFDVWREVYNFERPHEALNLDVPADRYRPSKRAMPKTLPKVEYDQNEIVRTVPSTKDYISFKGHHWKVPEAFRGERVAIRPKNKDGLYGVFFASHRSANIDLTKK